MRALHLTLAVALLSGCSATTTETTGLDAGMIGPEAGPRDSGLPDTRAMDAAAPEDAAAPVDAAGQEDAQAPDGTTTPDAGPSLDPGTQTFELTTPDGRTRRYLAYVPTNLAADPPVLLALHGGGGSAAGAEGFRMNPIADDEGFIVVYPEGIAARMGTPDAPNATWNAGVCCGRALDEDVDDVTYIGAVLDDLASRTGFDARRVYATGMSNGSMMAYRLACELSDRIAAIAPVAGQPVLQNCNPTRPVPIMHVHGTDDRCATYGGGMMCGGCFQRALNAILNTNLPVVTWPCDPVEDYVASWRTRNRCASDGMVAYQNGNVTCTSWECADSTQTMLCRMVGAGHNWPSGDPPAFCDRPQSRACRLWRQEVGTTSNEIGSRQIWDFLSRFSL